jgi:hypothetical protein
VPPETASESASYLLGLVESPSKPSSPVKWNEGEEVERGLFSRELLCHLSAEWSSQVGVARELESADHGVDRGLVGPERNEAIVSRRLVETGEAREGRRGLCNAQRQTAALA